MNPVADLLTRAKARTLAHPCKGWAANDAQGNRVNWNDPAAVCWCSYAATRLEASSFGDYELARDALSAAAEQCSPDTYSTVTGINDRRPDLIPQMFDLAIEEASK